MSITLNDLPEVNFAEKDINQILTDMISGYEKAYFESTGVRKKLYPGDPIRIFLYSQALREFQLRVIIDDAAKQNLLKYSRGDNLDNLAAPSKTERFLAAPAIVKVRFRLSQARPTDVTIPKNTRVSPGNGIYFATNEDVLISSGIQEIIINTTCTEAGIIGNGFAPEQISILVDPLPWTATVENIETSQGGMDEEDDDNYRERIHLAPEGYSVAGPSGAYEYFARQYSSLVSEVRVDSPSDGVVDIRILLQDGELPEQSFLEGIYSYLSDKERRPLTDKVEVHAPDIVNYNIDLIYYISSNNMGSEELIKTKVTEAVEEYIRWQKLKIGRDINPSELTAKIILAGAKRVEINSPIHTVIDKNSVAIVDSINATYGGIEDE